LTEKEVYIDEAFVRERLVPLVETLT